MNRVIHFEVHAADPGRAAGFYREAFGWEIREWVIPGVELPDEHRYWQVTTGEEGEPGIDGGIVFRRGPAPEPGRDPGAFVCTLGVDSVDDSLRRVAAAGGAVAVPKMPIPGVGWLAYCTDTEGNLFGVMQDDPSAG